MNIRTLSITAVFAVGLVSCGNPEQEKVTNAVAEETSTDATTGSYTIDVANSTVAWKGTMVGIYSHEGVIGLTKGSVSTEAGAVTGGDFTVDASAITTTDDDALYAMASREDLIGHLKSDDFLGVGSNPTGSFTITKANGNSVTGNLTIKGNTYEEVITGVTVLEGDGNITVTGSLTFNRKKYGISFEKGGEMVVSDDIELTISLSGSAD